MVVEHEVEPRQERSASARFDRVRRDHTREMAEDYAELILELGLAGQAVVRPADLVKRLGVSHVTVLRTLDRLTRDGVLLRSQEQGIQLSDLGRRLGKEAHDRHRLLVAFLENLGVPAAVAQEDAEGLEHHLSQPTLQRMAAALGRPWPEPE